LCQLYVEKIHPSGEPPWPHLLCCGMLAVGRLQLRMPRLASAAKSTREISRTIEYNIIEIGIGIDKY
jgi:hypothetical protein